MELAPRVENTETQEGWGRLWAVGILDQTPDPHPCPVLLSKSLSLRYPPLLPAPPPTPDPVGTLCRSSVGGTGVLAVSLSLSACPVSEAVCYLLTWSY